MRDTRFGLILGAVVVTLLTACGVFAQFKSQEVSEADGVPVLIKHLPDWENVRAGAILTNKAAELQTALGQRAVIDLIDFSGGTEAVTASYPAGKLLIVEYTNPQSSIEADAVFQKHLATEQSKTVYRRIGNYSAFVFDYNDEAAANLLLDDVKYEKIIQWLGEDPFKEKRRERFFAIRTADIFLSTAIVIVSGVGFALLTGIGIGLVFYRMRDQRRQSMTAFSDAGGMTRLNLDELTEEETSRRLLRK